jgi:gluconate 2-dehydrogenase
MTKNVLAFKSLPADQAARIRAVHNLTVADPKTELEAFNAALGEAHGLIGSTYPINADVLARAPKLEVVSSISVGVDNYDHAALNKRGIVLCHTPGVLDETVADTVFGLLIMTGRRMVELANLVKEGKWPKDFGPEYFGTDVHHKTVGFIGFGRIGQAIARRAALGFGMKVLYHTRRPVDLATQAPMLQGLATHTPRDELLAKSDYVVAMLPLSSETRGMFNSEFFGKMKQGAFFINGGRGATVDEAALVAALDSGHLGGAGLDVFVMEPLPMESPLRTHPKVTPLPHIGSATHETRHAMAALATDNLLQVLDGKPGSAVFDTSQ